MSATNHPGGPALPPAPGPSQGGPVPLDGVSVAALVLSLVFCAAPVAMILGVVGVVRTKGGQRRGRAAAIAGLAISTLTTAAVAIAIVAGGAYLAATSIDDLDPADARAGECIDLDFFDYPDAAPCVGEHEGEIIWVGRITGATAREWERVEYIDDFCLARPLDDAHLEALEDPAYAVDYWVDGPDWEPTPGDWMICYLTAAEGHLDTPIGALAG